MKKYVSALMAVLVLVLLAVPAMADGNSPEVPSTSTSGGITVSSGSVSVSAGQAEWVTQAFSSASGLGLNASDYSRAEAIRLNRTDGGSGSITCVITYQSSTDHIAKVVYQHDGHWYTAGLVYLGNGQYQLTFSEGLSPVVILYGSGRATEPGSAPKSPKTGYD